MNEKMTSIAALGLGLAALLNAGCASYLEKVPVNEPTTNRDRAFYCSERARSDRAKAMQNHAASVIMTSVGGLLTAGSATSFIVGMQASDEDGRSNAFAAGTALLAGAALTLLTKEAFGLDRREAEYAAAAANREQATNRLTTAKETDNTDRVFDDCVTQYPGFGLRPVSEVKPMRPIEERLVIPAPPQELRSTLEEARSKLRTDKTTLITAQEKLLTTQAALEEAKKKPVECKNAKKCTAQEDAAHATAVRDADTAVKNAEAAQQAAQDAVDDADLAVKDIQMKIAAWQLAKIEAMGAESALLTDAKLRYEATRIAWEMAQTTRMSRDAHRTP